MKDLKQFDIKFLGLKLGEHSFQFDLSDEFFQYFDFEEFENARLTADVIMVKKENSLDFTFKASGLVSVPCDLTNEPFDMPVENEVRMQVKFGDEYDDSNEDLLIINHGEHTVNVAQYLYEAVALSLPLKRVNPEVLSGEKGQEILEELEKHEARSTATADEEEEKETDPRWEELKKLLK